MIFFWTPHFLKRIGISVLSIHLWTHTKITNEKKNLQVICEKLRGYCPCFLWYYRFKRLFEWHDLFWMLKNSYNAQWIIEDFSSITYSRISIISFTYLKAAPGYGSCIFLKIMTYIFHEEKFTNFFMKKFCEGGVSPCH